MLDYTENHYTVLSQKPCREKHKTTETFINATFLRYQSNLAYKPYPTVSLLLSVFGSSRLRKT